jgi:DNA-binding response OmpR family regulator
MVGSTADLALARKLGADALIAKPFEADELIAALHDLLLPACRITELAFAA